MLQTIDLRSKHLESDSLADFLPRPKIDVSAALESVRPVLQAVRREGADALRHYSQVFDGIVPESLRVPTEQIQAALQSTSPRVVQALELAIQQVRAGHQPQLPQAQTTEVIPGGKITQRWIPASRVGLYVPGGLAVYPSSVVMNVVTAQVAGVSEIALSSPPQKEFGGGVHPTILATCALLGVDEVYAVGGAQAIAMFAYGARQEDGWLCPPVDVITGPGNIYVAAAKRAVSSHCRIDAEAGTTEIAVLADDSANPAYVAADLISQAEHDEAAASVLITDSVELCNQVQVELEIQVPKSRHHRRITTALSGPQSAAVLVRDMRQAVEVANAYAAEHLEIQTRNDAKIAEQITNAGAIFMGPYSPVPLGDYLAGSNHVLPTGGTARYQAGLSVMSFLKPVQQIHYTREALLQVSESLAILAEAEDLPAHGECVMQRREACDG